MSANLKKPRNHVRAAKRAALRFPDFRTGEEFDSLSIEDKERVAAFYAKGLHRPETRPLTASDRSELKNDRSKKKNAVQPSGSVKVISLSVRTDLLKRADAYANAHGLKRAELVAQALKLFLPTA